RKTAHHDPIASVLPYTTLFRSDTRPPPLPARRVEPSGERPPVPLEIVGALTTVVDVGALTVVGGGLPVGGAGILGSLDCTNPDRSEEHTSELQSRSRLVSRLRP